jgi:hypothetical protein
MDNLTNGIGDRAGPEWQRFPADAYLDHRHRNWVISEELGDVRFVSDAGVVLVHRERAEHIARALLGGSNALVRALPARTAPATARLPSSLVVGHAREAASSMEIINARTRWRDILGWLGIVAGAVVFVAALALSLDDPALVVALALELRGGRLILDIDS